MLVSVGPGFPRLLAGFRLRQVRRVMDVCRAKRERNQVSAIL
jgi:hypothetical protein